MPIEVEVKFPVPDLAAVQSQLEGLGATPSQAVEEIDVYYRHPARDFAATDEALRIRRVGPANRITYKGPKVDPTTKTRQEIELGPPDQVRNEPGKGFREPGSGAEGSIGFHDICLA